ncbi:hypothetical protein DNTS_025254 [Danionella cerebrum]|uniref:Sulfotransferase n=1 Tax=Danionella cerebrum TaxID=2873325 RepID=A0A553Q1D2_9TELE|nr:hypothetical protein DNTS_025254 [Danionella translucida]
MPYERLIPSAQPSAQTGPRGSDGSETLRGAARARRRAPPVTRCEKSEQHGSVPGALGGMASSPGARQELLKLVMTLWLGVTCVSILCFLLGRAEPESSGTLTGRYANGTALKGRPSPLEEGDSSRRLPHALIIGVKKGGTRALLEFLRLHPDVRALGSEPHFFDRHYARGLTWYRSNSTQTLYFTLEKKFVGKVEQGAVADAEPGSKTTGPEFLLDGERVTPRAPSVSCRALPLFIGTLTEVMVRAADHLPRSQEQLEILQKDPEHQKIQDEEQSQLTLNSTISESTWIQTTLKKLDPPEDPSCGISYILPFTNPPTTHPLSLSVEQMGLIRCFAGAPEPQQLLRWCSDDLRASMMPKALRGQIVMEKTPRYFVSPETPARIHAMSRSIKLLVVVRDPITRAISDYTQIISKTPDVPSFESLTFRNSSDGQIDFLWSPLYIGLYARHLERWLAYFPLSQIHFVHGERLISDPAGELGRVQDFLGLQRIITDKHFYFNKTKGFPCLKKPEGSSKPHCLGKTKGRTHVRIHPEVLQKLRDFYQPHNHRFYQMTGMDFGWQ